MEDKALEFRWLVNAAQAARTPMDKNSSRGLRSYVRKLHNAIDRMAPWSKNEKLERLKKLRGVPADNSAVDESERLAKKLGL